VKPFDILKEKLAYFGGYKWLPYVDAVELVEENQKLKQDIALLQAQNMDLTIAIRGLKKEIEEK
jgi:hypothetical protein